MSVQPVLIESGWAPSSGTQTFQALNPRTGEPLPEQYPISPWAEIERAVQTAARISEQTRSWSGDRFARFLELYATGIEQRAADLVAIAHAETALPVEPRLSKAELPRTVNQLRQAAQAARDGSWLNPVIDRANNIRSMHAPIGPVCVFGPNNFPFAFNSIAGGDFAAAVAAGNPVIAKGHSSHPGTTRLFAEIAHEAVLAAELPAGFVQLIYRTSHTDGTQLVSHRLIGATGYTGARNTGLVLKAAADKTGKPIYLELSSINPVVILPGALAERGAALADEFTASCLMGAGQFCTNPGLVLLIDSVPARQFLSLIGEKFTAAPVGTLLGQGVLENFKSGVSALKQAGAVIVAGGAPGGGTGCCHQNTLFSVTGDQFLAQPHALQTEIFGNASLVVLVRDPDQLATVLKSLEGNLTGTIYSSQNGDDEPLYGEVAAALRPRVGRLLNDKMPTGVAVSPAMNHGGPFPATGHPGFTAVGIPAAIRRFTMLECYDNIRPNRLPPALQDRNPTGKLFRSIDGVWTTADVGSA